MQIYIEAVQLMLVPQLHPGMVRIFESLLAVRYSEIEAVGYGGNRLYALS
jgi:hypothetical protein